VPIKGLKSARRRHWIIDVVDSLVETYMSGSRLETSRDTWLHRVSCCWNVQACLWIVIWLRRTVANYSRRLPSVRTSVAAAPAANEAINRLIDCTVGCRNCPLSRRLCKIYRRQHGTTNVFHPILKWKVYFCIPLSYKKLSCRRETAPCFVSFCIFRWVTQGHSRSLKLVPLENVVRFRIRIP